MVAEGADVALPGAARLLGGGLAHPLARVDIVVELSVWRIHQTVQNIRRVGQAYYLVSCEKQQFNNIKFAILVNTITINISHSS